MWASGPIRIKIREARSRLDYSVVYSIAVNMVPIVRELNISLLLAEIAFQIAAPSTCNFYTRSIVNKR